jgi:predicted MPP superfamily phosphohydrolase
VLFFFIFLVSSDVVMFALKCVVPFSSDGEKLELKLRLSLLMLISATLTLYGYHNTTPVINRVDINIKDLPKSLEGFNIVQISDIHLGPTVGKTQLKWIVDQINSLHPDMVVITGDLIDSSIERISEAVEPLADVVSKHGAYFAPGNHDYYSGDIDKWLVKIKELGVTSLMNERVFIAPGPDKDDGFYLAGLEDYSTKLVDHGTHGMDVKHALTGRKDGVPTVVLAHQPSAALEAIEWKDVRLVLSGHTHAGQFFPVNMLIYLVNPFFVGLYQPKENVFVYVSPGTKYFLFPIRHFFDPEITNIFLHSQ